MNEFFWRPGESYDKQAVARICDNFKRPVDPMGEAWFMGNERRMYTELSGDLRQLPVDTLTKALYEITSGTSCFGPFDEWNVWFHYLLGRLIPRGCEFSGCQFLLESLITAFISQYPSGVRVEPYPGFLDDSLNSLGRCLMDSTFCLVWNEQHWRWYQGRCINVFPPPGQNFLRHFFSALSIFPRKI
jgi:hypothetical protein